MSDVDRIAPALARARRTAALSRATCALAGIVVLAVAPGSHTYAGLALFGFAVLFGTAVVESIPSAPRRPVFEETLGAVAALSVIGLGEQRVDVLTLLWLAAAIAGIMARGGRLHWAGRAILVAALLLPLVTEQRLGLAYAAFALGTVTVLLSTGRLTRELRALLDRARYDADHDSLTGTLVRNAFRDRLDQLAAAGPLAVIVIDLDGFGQVNKSLGHAAGDRLLALCAERARRLLEPGDLIGRLGGDEFAVVTHHRDPVALAERLRAGLASPARGEEGTGGSIGVALAPDHGRDAEALLRAADVAQRIAKRSGKGRVRFFDGQCLTEAGPTGARGALARLVEGKGVEMVVEPILDIALGTVHAYEALARFRTRGTSSPLHWFALAEEYGMRFELELTCLRKAVVLLDSLPDGVRLSVNLSAGLLDDARTIAILGERSDLHRLVIEVTEHSLVGDDIDDAMAPHRANGIAFAVDDMGAGYSGLRQITSVRPEYLKLDRALVRELDQAPERAALIEALVSYAARTGSRLVAEGVETEAELETLRALGVTLVQGFLLGRPGAQYWRDPDVRSGNAVLGGSA